MPGREETERRQHVPESGREEDGGFIATSAAEPESTPLAEVGFIPRPPHSSLRHELGEAW